MKIVILGSGMEGTLYGVRLASAGHSVTLIARGPRATELRTRGAVIEHALTGKRLSMTLAVTEKLQPQQTADLCLVTVRREQLDAVLPTPAEARGVARILIMVNHACGSTWLREALGHKRAILKFPGAAEVSRTALSDTWRSRSSRWSSRLPPLTSLHCSSTLVFG